MPAICPSCEENIEYITSVEIQRVRAYYTMSFPVENSEQDLEESGIEDTEDQWYECPSCNHRIADSIVSRFGTEQEASEAAPNTPASAEDTRPDTGSNQVVTGRATHRRYNHAYEGESGMECEHCHYAFLRNPADIEGTCPNCDTPYTTTPPAEEQSGIMTVPLGIANMLRNRLNPRPRPSYSEPFESNAPRGRSPGATIIDEAQYFNRISGSAYLSDSAPSSPRHDPNNRNENAQSSAQQ